MRNMRIRKKYLIITEYELKYRRKKIKKCVIAYFASKHYHFNGFSKVFWVKREIFLRFRISAVSAHQPREAPTSPGKLDTGGKKQTAR